MSDGSLILIKKDGSEGSKFPMHKENVYKLGPGSDCHLRFNINNFNENVCCIATSNKGLATISKLSSCSILLNNLELKSPKSLKYGDIIRIGTKTFKWSTLTTRESFTRNVFNINSKLKRSDVRSSPRKSATQLSTLRETTNTPKVEEKIEKKTSTIKKKYFEEVKEKPSKIPRKFFPDTKPSTSKINTSQDVAPVTDNTKTPISDKRKSIRTNKKTSSPTLVVDVNARTPDSLGCKPITPSIKLVKSVSKKYASLKKSLDKKVLAKKRKISNVVDEEFYEAKKLKFSNDSTFDNEPSLLENETMGSLFHSSLLETTDNFSIEDTKSSTPMNQVQGHTNKTLISPLKILNHTPQSPLFENSLINTPKNVLSPEKNIKTPASTRKSIRQAAKTPMSSRKGVSPMPRNAMLPKNLNISVENADSTLETETSSNIKTPTVSRRSLSRASKCKSSLKKTPSTRTTKTIISPINASIIKNIFKTPGRSPKSTDKNLAIISGVKKILKTPPKKTKSPKNDLTNIVGLKRLLKTPGKLQKSPKNDLTNIVGVKKLLKTPNKTQKSPKNDLTNIKGIRKLLKTPSKTQNLPKNNLMDISGVKTLFATPTKSPNSKLASPEKNTTLDELNKDNSPKRTYQRRGKSLSPIKPTKVTQNRLSLFNNAVYDNSEQNVHEWLNENILTNKQSTPKKDLRNELQDCENESTPEVVKPRKNTSKQLKSPKNDLTNIVSLKKLLKTPNKPQKSPKNDLTDVRGVKTLLKTPGRKPKSPKNDLTNVAGVKKLLATPRRLPKSPKNDLTNIVGVKKLLKTPNKTQKTPKNDLTDVRGVRNLLKSSGKTPKSPKNDLTNVAGVKKLLRSPYQKSKSPKNDLTNVTGVKNLLGSPNKIPNSPKNDLSNVSGVKELLETSINKTRTSYNTNTTFDELKDGKKEDLLLSFSPKSPIRTYERKVKSLSPVKPTKVSENRLSLCINANYDKSDENVQKWLNEHVLNNEQIAPKVELTESETQPTPEPVRGRRRRNEVVETEVIKPVRRGRKKLEVTEVVESPRGRTGRKRIKEQTSDEIENITVKRTRTEIKQVQFNIPASESFEVKPKGKRRNKTDNEESPKTKKLKLEEVITSSPVRTTRQRRNNGQQKQEDEKPVVRSRRGRNAETETTIEPVEKKTRSRKANTNITETVVQEPEEKKVTRSRRGKKEETPAVEITTNTRSRRGKKTVKNIETEEPAEEKVIKRGGRKQKVEDDTVKPSRSTRSRKTTKNNEEETKEPETRTRSTRAKKNEVIIPEEPVRKTTRSRRK